MVRRNFEKRSAAKMSQLMQDARKDLENKPTWMGERMWEQLKAIWNSSNFQKKSEINKRNRNSMDGASLHTGGSIPHRVLWKKMKETKGEDPTFSDFYFRTHRTKDKNWVGIHAESAYEKFENKKIELSSEASTFVPGEDEADSQPTKVMPSDIDIWVDVVGRKKGRIFGLGSIAKTLNPNQPSMRSDSEVDALRSQVHALNESLQKQEQEKLLMKQQLQRQEKEMAETNRNLTFLMQHLGFVGSSSRPSSSPQLNDETDEDSEDVGSDHIE
nr:uncharacterized protein LOC113784914 [Cicer arietinum]